MGGRGGRLAVVGAIVALCAGCGSGSATKAATKQTTTTASSGKLDPAFTAKLVGWCDQELAQLKKINGTTFPYPNFDPANPDPKLLPEVGQFYAKDQPLDDALPGQLSALGQPKSGAQTWRAMNSLLVSTARASVTSFRAAEAGQVSQWKSAGAELTSDYSSLVTMGTQAGVPGSSSCMTMWSSR